MKVYEAVFKDTLGQGVYGISLVENPAMEDEWITLSEQPKQIQFSAVDDSRNLLLGAVLIPNKKIYRNVDGHEFYITFTKDTISKLAHDFIKKGNQNNSSAEHEVKLNDVSFVESWQVENTEKDKSALYGKSYEPGTWVTMAHVSDELYQQAKEGTFKGFSIDAMLGLQEIKFKTDISKMEKTMDWKDFFKALFSAKEEVDTNNIETQAETVTEETESQEPEVNIEDMKEALTDVIARFSKEQDEKIENLRVEFSGKLQEKEEELETAKKENEQLKTELNKQPETAAVVVAPVEMSTGYVQTTAKTVKGRLYETLNEITKK